MRAVGCVFAEEEARFIQDILGDDEVAQSRVVKARASGVPLEHALGWAEYDGLLVSIAPGVFVPRPRTLLLVEAVAALSLSPARVVDLGTGCGALAASMTRRFPAARVIATELDPVAVWVAAGNGARFGFSVRHGSWWEPLPESWRAGVELAVAYLPHVPLAQLDRLASDFRRHEPLSTVAGGADGLDPLRVVVHDAGNWLATTGLLTVLLAEEQVSVARSLWPRTQVLAQDDGDVVVAFVM